MHRQDLTNCSQRFRESYSGLQGLLEWESLPQLSFLAKIKVLFIKNIEINKSFINIFKALFSMRVIASVV